MGNKSNKSASLPKLKQSEIQEFSKQSLFTPDQIKELFFHFHKISVAEVDDGVIDFVELCHTLRKLIESLLSERIFRLFDANHDGVINFREFLLGLSTCNQETASLSGQNRLLATTRLTEQIEISFRMLDSHNNGRIYLHELEQFLTAALLESAKIQLSNEEVTVLVKKTLEDVPVEEDGAGEYIGFDAYKKFILKHPTTLRWLSVDLERITQGVRQQRNRNMKARCLSV